MKRLFLLIMLVVSFTAYSLDKIVLNSGEWEPYASSTNPDARIGELVVEKAFNAVGVEVEYRYYPWQRTYESTKRLDGDAAVLYTKTPEREEDMLFSKSPIFDSKTVVFYRKGVDFQWNELKDLGNYNVGGIIGYSTVTELEAAGIEVDLVKRADQNFKKLVAGRIDIFPDNEITGTIAMRKALSKDEMSQILIHPKPIFSRGIHIIVSKTHPKREEILQLFEEGLDKIKASGEYDKIFKM